MRTIVKRSVVIGGRKTSISIEEPFWNSFKDMTTTRGMTLSKLVAAIDAERTQSNLSSALRSFVLDHYRDQAGGTTAASSA